LGFGAVAVAGIAGLSKKASAQAPADAPRYQSSDGKAYWERSYSGGPVDAKPLPPLQPGKGYRPVVVPNGAALPFRIVDGVKVFHLIAEEVDHEFAHGLRARCWGYNGRVNSTVIEAVEGERVRIYVTNRLTAPTSVHWHGVYLPNGMDGLAGLTQPY